MTALALWTAAPDVPDLLPGEDRTLDCHTVTHYGYAQVRGLGSEAFAHLTSAETRPGVVAATLAVDRGG
jgi:hypothetical protein